MSSPFQTVTFGKNDDDLKVVSNKSFKFKKGVKTRVALAAWSFDDDGYLNLEGTPEIISAPVSWVDTEDVKGYVVHHPKDVVTSIVGEEPRWRCATVLVIFPTLPDGDLDMDLLRLGRWEVVPWAFSNRKYDELKSKHKRYHLGKVDLQIECTNEGFQNLKYETYENNILRMLIDKARADKANTETPNNEMTKKVDAMMAEIRRTQGVLQGLIGKVVDVDDLRKAFGQASSSATSSLSSAVSAEATQDVENMLDGF